MEDSVDRPNYEPASTPPPSAMTKYSSMQRLWMMFTSPGEVFSDIRVKPSWVLVMVVLVMLGVVVQALVIPHVDTEATIRARLEQRGTELSEAQIENAIEQAQKFSKFGPIINLILAPIAWAVMAAVFLVMLKIVGSDTEYRQTLSTILHAYWPATAVQLVLTGILIQRVGKVPQEELATVVKASIGAFMSADSPAWRPVAYAGVRFTNSVSLFQS